MKDKRFFCSLWRRQLINMQPSKHDVAPSSSTKCIISHLLAETPLFYFLVVRQVFSVQSHFTPSFFHLALSLLTGPGWPDSGGWSSVAARSFTNWDFSEAYFKQTVAYPPLSFMLEFSTEIMLYWEMSDLETRIWNEIKHNLMQHWDIFCARLVLGTTLSYNSLYFKSMCVKLAEV